jgi:hypothetical protein
MLVVAIGYGHAGLMIKGGMMKCLRCGCVQSPDYMSETVCEMAPDEGSVRVRKHDDDD